MLNCTDMTVLERQRARLGNQQEQFHHHNYLSELSGVISNQGFQGGFMETDSLLREMVMVKPDPGLDNGWPDLGTIEMPDSTIPFSPPCGYGNGSNFEIKYTMSPTSSCPPPSTAAKMTEKESPRKRKAEKVQQNSKVVAEEESKRSKGYAEEGDSKITDQNTKKTSSSTKNKKETSADTSKGNSKISDGEKPDYIHVRARRGQATDSHSLAERVRREKISERMRYLQDLVPGCNKITGKAGMLDEIINYVQSLQRQVEFLSMKLATVNPRLDFSIDNLFTKEVFPVGTTNFPAIGMSTEMTNPAYLQFNPAQQAVSCCGMEMTVNPNDMALRRTISTPISTPEAFIDSSCISQQFQPSATWDAAELQNLYSMAFDQGRSAPFPSQPFAGCIQPSNQNMEI